MLIKKHIHSVAYDIIQGAVVGLGRGDCLMVFVGIDEQGCTERDNRENAWVVHRTLMLMLGDLGFRANQLCELGQVSAPLRTFDLIIQ